MRELKCLILGTIMLLLSSPLLAMNVIDTFSVQAGKSLYAKSFRSFHFGKDGYLYIGSIGEDTVLKIDPSTMTKIDQFKKQKKE